MARPVTLGLVQTKPVLGDQSTNLEQVLSLTADAARQGAEFVIFPELALTGYNQDLLGDKLVQLALTPQDEPIQKLTQAAAQHQVYLAVGFIERRAMPGIIYNSIVICGPDGQILTSYAKAHLFSNEHLHFRTGDTIEVVPTQYGPVGPMICMDIGYPEVGRLLALQGAELLIAPSAWIRQDADIWGLHLQARALDNFIFVAGVNRVGIEGNLDFVGRSMIVNPRGHILAELDGNEGTLIATIDLDEVTSARRRAMHLTGRRPELYGPLLK
jgi:predicted amidohydrolase